MFQEYKNIRNLCDRELQKKNKYIFVNEEIRKDVGSLHEYYSPYVIALNLENYHKK